MAITYKRIFSKYIIHILLIIIATPSLYSESFTVKKKKSRSESAMREDTAEMLTTMNQTLSRVVYKAGKVAKNNASTKSDLDVVAQINHTMSKSGKVQEHAILAIEGVVYSDKSTRLYQLSREQLQSLQQQIDRVKDNTDHVLDVLDLYTQNKKKPLSKKELYNSLTALRDDLKKVDEFLIVS